jgi:Mce-associated membrane protein
MRSFNPLVATAAALAVIAAACAAWFGVSWYNAAHSSSAALARTRDQVLESGQQAVINLNTLDYRNAAAGLQTWLASSTGDLHTQLAHALGTEVKLVQQEQHSTNARILDSAITALDPAGGTATAMFAVDITVTPAKGNPYSEYQAEVAQLAKTTSGWKLSGLTYATSGSGASPAPSPTPSPTPSPSRSR